MQLETIFQAAQKVSFANKVTVFFWSQVDKSSPKNSFFNNTEVFLRFCRQDAFIKLPHNKQSTVYTSAIKTFVVDADGKPINSTQKPIVLYEWLLKTFASPQRLVLDLGSGTRTLAIAAILREIQSVCLFEQQADQIQASIRRISSLKGSLNNKDFEYDDKVKMWSYKKGFFKFIPKVLLLTQPTPETEESQQPSKTQTVQELVQVDINFPDQFCPVCKKGIEDNESSECLTCKRKFHPGCGDKDPVSNQYYCSHKCINEVS